MTDYCYHTEPFKHQHEGFMLSRDREYFALLMEQGTGKSKIIVDNSSWLYSRGHIDTVLIIAPNGVQRNWVINEYPAHCPDYVNHKAAWYSASPTKKEEQCLASVLKHNDGLKVVAINVESLATAKGLAFINSLLMNFSVMLVVDESTTIKNPKAIRTKNLLKLSVHAKYRRILTGTPVTQGPLDLFTQFTFLDSHILRCSSYFAFRGQYAIMKPIRISGGREIQVVDRYHNLEKLQSLIAPHSYRVTKSECLDLPEKLYSKRYVELSHSQKSLYNSLKKEVVAEFNGMTMSAPLALTKLLRLQQIVGGFFVPDVMIDNDIFEPGEYELDLPYKVSGQSGPQPIDERNLRVESLIELLEETQGKVIIWARFRSELSAISNRISESFGKESLVQYHGGVTNEERSAAVSSFQNNDRVRFFVGHVQAGGKGLTLHAARTVVYFSNDFSLENRLQSEDRAHRIGQKNNVTYIDMVAIDTLDETVVTTLRNKKNVADLITGDTPISSWI